MSSARQEFTSRSWWAISSKTVPPSQPSRSFSSEKLSSKHAKPSNGLGKFNTIASAIGLKSKRHPSLAIQDPPSSSHYPTRPTTSSTINSFDDINEPRTPSDRERLSFPQSLLTLSDPDPFASRGIQATEDPKRLSAFSASSMTDIAQKNQLTSLHDRSSYASSSTSHSHSEFLDDTRGHAQGSSPKKLHLQNGLRSKAMPFDNSPSKETISSNHTRRPLAKSGSSSTLTDKKRSSDPDPSPHPSRVPMRARGMTESNPSWVAHSVPHFFRKASHPPPKEAPPLDSLAFPPIPSNGRPCVIVRQASNSRIVLPQKAPPTHSLPPPPTEDKLDDDVIPETSTGSGSSSSLSFASSASSARDLSSNGYSPRFEDREPSFGRNMLRMSNQTWERVAEPSESLTLGRGLKKATSYQALSKRAPTNTPFSAPVFPPTPSSSSSEKLPRKQRSFHHPRLALPPIALPLRQMGPAPPPSPDASLIDQRRGSAPSIPVRKRLFSGSSVRRPSTSQLTSPTDDSLSVFSLPFKKDSEYKSSLFGAFPPDSTSTPHSSFWDESPNSPIPSTQEYVPQHIKSPAELRAMEAIFASEDSSFSPITRTRGYSIASTSTSISEGPSVESSLLSRASRIQNGRPVPPSRVNSVINKSPNVYTHRTLRPSTSQANMTPPPVSSSPPRQPVSLPPPPRLRPRPSTGPSSHDFLPEHSSTTFTSLPPPPRRLVEQRNRPVVEKRAERRSMMRKPSFLEIDDGAERRFTKSLDSSFLDLESTRESFETTNSVYQD